MTLRTPTTADILHSAEKWVGVPYGPVHSRTDYAFINCSTLTARILDEAFYGHLGAMPTATWLDYEIADPDGPGPEQADPWSSVKRAIADGIADPLPDGADMPVWDGVHFGQFWHEIPTRGHAMLGFWFGGKLKILNTPYTGTSVQWRGVGHDALLPLRLDDAPAVDPAALAKSYAAGIRWARLKTA